MSVASERALDPQTNAAKADVTREMLSRDQVVVLSR